MRTLRYRIAPALFAAFALLAAPTPAAAEEGYEVEPKSVSLQMTMPGTHGYVLSTFTFGHHLVSLEASRGSVSASYTVLGTVSRHGIKADFGRLGRIAVRFHGSPRPLKDGPFAPRKCKGKPPIREVGRFEGTIRFEGEQGFTAVSARRARGSVVRGFRRVCKRPGVPRRTFGPAVANPQRRAPSPPTIFAAASKAAGRTVFLYSAGSELSLGKGRGDVSLTLVLAGLQERRGRVSIGRLAFIEGDEGSVLASPPGVTPASATVALPKPFGGSGAYSEATGAPPSWTGSLVVWLPGAGAVPLAGPEFTAALCRPNADKELRRCLSDVTKVLGPESLLLS